MSTAMALPGARSRRFGLVHLLAIALPLLALRVYCASTLGANSDEPQHLHVVWAWTLGLVPYRDVFDNHAPLFDLLCAPLLAWLGERADIVGLMRLAMIPIYVGALWLACSIGRALWSERVGLLAAAIAATAPVFFTVSAEFRPDDLWMLLWLGAVAAAVSPRCERYRPALVGALVGAALATSLKTLLLIAAAALAGLTLAALAGRAPLRRPLRSLLIGAAAAAVVPGAFAAGFAAIGAWDRLRYCLFAHNVVAGLGHWDGGAARWLIPALGYPLAVVALWLMKPQRDRERWERRTWVVLSAVVYLLLLYGFWPLITHQDLLPVVPLIAVGVAAAILDDDRKRAASRTVLAVLVVGANALTLATVALPRRNELRDQETELARVLALTRPGDTVMDAKGAAVFRQRPTYWVLEDITERRMREGSIPDDITEKLVASGTPVVVADRLPPRDARFVAANYVPAGGLVRVLGKTLGSARPGRPLVFEIAVPADYRIVAPAGAAAGELDGTPLAGARRLEPGRHVFVPSADSELALVWAPALERGFDPRGVFAVR